MIERLEHKVTYIEGLLKENKQHWEEVFWWMLARNFGLKVNSDAFEDIARSIPIHILAKHKHQKRDMFQKSSRDFYLKA